MGDLPGPEKPLFPDEGHKLNANQLMAQFRAQMSTGQTQKRLRANGAGGRGEYDGRSSRFLGKKVKERHKMVVMLHVTGWKNNEIAAAMGYTQGRVSIILSSKRPELQAVRAEAAQRVLDNTVDLQAKFALYAPDALDRMVEIMNQTEDVANARLAAKDVLDRAGYSPVKKTAHVEATVPFDQLAALLPQIEKANEAVLKEGEYEVHTITKDGAA